MPTSGSEKGWMLSCKKIVLHILMLDFSTNAIITQSSSLSCLAREEVGKTSQLRLQLIACSLFFEEKEKWKVLIKQLVCSTFYPGWSEISQICKIICFEDRIELPFFILKWGWGGERFQVNWQWPCKAPPNKCNKRRIFFHFASPKKWVLQIKFNPAMFDRVNFYFLFPTTGATCMYCKFQRVGALKSFPSEWTFQFVEIEGQSTLDRLQSNFYSLLVKFFSLWDDFDKEKRCRWWWWWWYIDNWFPEELFCPMCLPLCHTLLLPGGSHGFITDFVLLQKTKIYNRFWPWTNLASLKWFPSKPRINLFQF